MVRHHCNSRRYSRHKPEPDVFLEAARRLGIAAENCIVFEDADLGVEALNEQA